MFLIGIRVRPSSTVSCTGMSRIMLMSLPAVVAPVGAKLANGAGATWSAGPRTSDAISGCTASAPAAELSVDMRVSEPAALGGRGEHLVDLQGVLAVGGAVRAVEH